MRGSSLCSTVLANSLLANSDRPNCGRPLVGTIGCKAAAVTACSAKKFGRVFLRGKKRSRNISHRPFLTAGPKKRKSQQKGLNEGNGVYRLDNTIGLQLFHASLFPLTSGFLTMLILQLNYSAP